MTPSFMPAQSNGEPPSRRGRRQESIEDHVGATHRAWLELVRERFRESGLTLEDLVNLSGYSKARISELLRGKGYYPRWQITYSVVRSLNVPVWPLRRLWTAAAREANKDDAWIRDGIQAVLLEPERRPVAHKAFTEVMGPAYTAYARALLQGEQRAKWVVSEAFDILWLSWDEASSSSNMRRYAWQLLRSRVMLRAHRHHDGHPDLRAAAFSTVTQSQIDDIEERFAHIGKIADFFDAIARLHQDQRDIMILRYLCGIDPDAIPNIVGLSPAKTHTDDHHARWALKSAYPRHDNRE
ncbi:XRE family transcriptional regulator [Streptomyces minutiscleroticus]|uniref:XRE family transcriptional regulator n=1 Tax=Streptomyces minutiscleroticus TaxID=68238 RepID=UPI000A7DA69D